VGEAKESLYRGPMLKIGAQPLCGKSTLVTPAWRGAENLREFHYPTLRRRNHARRKSRRQRIEEKFKVYGGGVGDRPLLDSNPPGVLADLLEIVVEGQRKYLPSP